MFVDYYSLLGIPQSATAEDIKKAYREMSIRWHPDKNPDTDTTAAMQAINEAYAILKDAAKRIRYDKEYVLFRKTVEVDNSRNGRVNANPQSQTEWTYREYNVHDQNLQNDIEDAREYAKDLVTAFMKELNRTTKTAAKGAAKKAIDYTVAWVITGLFLAFAGALLRGCQS